MMIHGIWIRYRDGWKSIYPPEVWQWFVSRLKYMKIEHEKWIFTEYHKIPGIPYRGDK
jgi:hypothetical protein